MVLNKRKDLDHNESGSGTPENNETERIRNTDFINIGKSQLFELLF